MITASDLLAAVLEHADVIRIERDGTVYMLLSAPAALFDNLQLFDADAPEGDEDEGAPDAAFFGSGCSAEAGART